jgi:hypothetical protein
MSDAQIAGAALAAGSVIAGLVLLIAGEVHARSAPPIRHARRGAPACEVSVLAVPRSPDAWPFPIADTIPTRPMVRPS